MEEKKKKKEQRTNLGNRIPVTSHHNQSSGQDKAAKQIDKIVVITLNVVVFEQTAVLLHDTNVPTVRHDRVRARGFVNVKSIAIQNYKLAERDADDENHHANVGNSRACVPFAFKARDSVIAGEIPRALNVRTFEETEDTSADPNVHSVEPE